MTISFFSNFLSHHQIPFCEEMCRFPDVEFHFISTALMGENRKRGGWALDAEYPFELKAYESKEARQEALRLAGESDVMIIGSAPEEYVTYRMKHGARKLTFRYSERFYKGGRWRVLSPRGAWIRFNTYFRYLNKPLYMLCASAYTAGDLAMLGSYLGRCYKWGYFPELREYADVNSLISQKEPRSILWTGRMIEWKHPEAAVEVVRRLRDEGYDVRLDMIGGGKKEDTLRAMIAKYNLDESVCLLGTMKPGQVRDHMERHQIFLFTSDQKEGWGAVLNEAMNSGCAVVANWQIGSVPFLMKDGVNGLVYTRGSVNALYKKVKYLLDHEDAAVQLGENAYHTITQQWSPKVAADRFHVLCRSLLEGKKGAFEEGPCSKTRIFIRK